MTQKHVDGQGDYIVVMVADPVTGFPVAPGASTLGAPYTDQQLVTSTAVALAAQPLKNGLVLTAAPGNAGTVLYGAAGLTNAYDGSGAGDALQPGLARSVACDDASKVFVILASGNTSATDFVTISGN